MSWQSVTKHLPPVDTEVLVWLTGEGIPGKQYTGLLTRANKWMVHKTIFATEKEFLAQFPPDYEYLPWLRLAWAIFGPSLSYAWVQVEPPYIVSDWMQKT